MYENQPFLSAVPKNKYKKYKEAIQYDYMSLLYAL